MIEKPLRPIRSYVKRQGRITPCQKAALSGHFEHYGLAKTAPFVWAQVFAKKAPLALEIGFGRGETLLALAKAHPQWNFVGMEVHLPGVGYCLSRAHDLALTNLKVWVEDAKVALPLIPNESLDKVSLLFPDPWPKKRHHKRRLVQPDFVKCVAEKLKKNGKFYLATDWQSYAEQMAAVLDACPLLLKGESDFYRPLQTKFEKRGKKLGHAIWDFVYQRIS